MTRAEDDDAAGRNSGSRPGQSAQAANQPMVRNACGLDEDKLRQLTRLAEERLGLHFPEDRRRELLRGLESAARELDVGLPALCSRLLGSAADQDVADILAAHLTIGETYFFREKRALDLLATRILPELVQARRRSGDLRLRLWSAGCCTGEEPYTLAMILLSVIPDADLRQARVLGTDVNERFLAKARKGEYGGWSFRETTPEAKRRWFEPRHGGRLAVRPEVKALVRFERLNLAEDAYPAPERGVHAMDVIFCRNVLMYFSPRRLERALRGLSACLTEGGRLFVSPTEAPLVHASRAFELEPHEGVTVFRKRSPRPALGTGWGTGWSPDGERATESDTLSRLGAAALPAPASIVLPVLAPAAPLAFEKPIEDARGRVEAEKDRNDPLAEPRRLLAAGRQAEAVQALQAVVEGGAQSSGEVGAAMVLAARALADLGRLDEAAGWCARAIDQDRLDAGRYHLLGAIEQERGDLPAAATALRRALYLEPNSPLLHFTLGSIQARQGRSAEADRSLGVARDLLRGKDPDEPAGGAADGEESLTAGGLAAIIDAMLGRRNRGE